jgi:hypothetical protein
LHVTVKERKVTAISRQIRNNHLARDKAFPYNNTTAAEINQQKIVSDAAK